MTPIEIYVKQQADKAFPLPDEDREFTANGFATAGANQGYASGLTFGLELGMRFSEWAVINKYKWSIRHQTWYRKSGPSKYYTGYTTAELMAEFLKHENQKG